jgi:hypothetical protein
VAHSGHVHDTSVQGHVQHTGTRTTSHLMAKDSGFQGPVSTSSFRIFVMDVAVPLEYRPLMSLVDPQASRVQRKSPLLWETLLSNLHEAVNQKLRRCQEQRPTLHGMRYEKSTFLLYSKRRLV